MMKKHLMRNDRFSGALIIALVTVAMALVFFPFYNVFIISFAKYKDIAGSNLYLYPRSVDLTAYLYIITDQTFLNALSVTAFITIVGAAWNMFLSTGAAYALSKKNMPGRNVFLWIIIFTIYFSGGMIPYFLLVKQLGLVDSVFSMILPASMNTYFMIIMKNYFITISPSLEESAKIDGANDIFILYRIVMPISAPFMATFSLFYAVERWNEWYNALLFISDTAKQPLQILLRNILINNSNTLSSMAQSMMVSHVQIYGQSLQMACIVVSSIPIMIVYPFLQKYFVKGIIIGAIKD